MVASLFIFFGGDGTLYISNAGVDVLYLVKNPKNNRETFILFQEEIHGLFAKHRPSLLVADDQYIHHAEDIRVWDATPKRIQHCQRARSPPAASPSVKADRSSTSISRVLRSLVPSGGHQICSRHPCHRGEAMGHRGGVDMLQAPLES